MKAALVSTAWLRARLGRPGVRVVDCRYRLGEPGAGERLWREAHIPGAAFLDLDSDLAAAPGARGRHPLPSAEQFEAAARRAGIGPGARVIAYDEAGEGGAARLWWLLRHFGHEEVSVLDCGLRGWRQEGGPLRAGDEDIAPGMFSARAGQADSIDAGELAHGAGSRVLLDARVPERYRGELEPVDAVAGHIPGAVNLPFPELVPGGCFPSAEELRRRFEAVGAVSGREAVAYCGSGVTACVLVLAAEVAGIEPVRLYPGSWSEWSGLGLPVEPGGSDARH
jgi:thiosulfate/3-mercaptopyruvate sulfurtransferase